MLRRAPSLLLLDAYFNHWEVELREQPKMDFYSGVKQEFGEEQYLNLPKRSHIE